MSSIKRDVKKKSSASTGGEKICFSRSSPLSVGVPLGASERFWLWLVGHPCGVHLPMVTTPIVPGKVGKRVLVVFSVHHGSIGGSRPIAISGETRGHSV